MHLHVLRVAGFSAFVFYKRKIRNRVTNTTGNDKRRKTMTNEKMNRIRELEEKLSYLIEENMPLKQKLLLLTEALWQTQDSGHCEAMTNQILGEMENEKTLAWEKNCYHKKLIFELRELLKEQESIY